MNCSDLEKRLLFILHRGCVEMRLLALGIQNDKDILLKRPQIGTQIADLADILEFIPGCFNPPHPSLPSHTIMSRIAILRESFIAYKKKHPLSTFDYIRYLDVDDPPEHY